jgi:hypothetical protein
MRLEIFQFFIQLTPLYSQIRKSANPTRVIHHLKAAFENGPNPQLT